MTFISLAEARRHLREDDDVPDETIQPYVDGAEAAAAAYLNRSLFADQASLTAAQDAVPGTIGAASAAYTAAVRTANATTDAQQRQAIIDLANERMDAARVTGRRIIGGLVVTADVVAAIKLTLGHLYANRETSVIGSSVAELPEGAKALLRPHRRIQMP